jgi:anti-sigma factor RsiW
VACKDSDLHLFQYVDGELPEGPRARFEEHLAACAECRHRLELERAFQEIHLAPLRPDETPAAVRARAEARLDALAADRRERVRAGARLRRLALAAGLALAAVGGAWGGLTWWHQREAAASLRELARASVEQHHRLTRTVLPYDVEGVPPSEAERWFKRRLDFNVSLPDVTRPDLAFRGGRVTHLRDFDVAALHYQVEGSDVSLFVIPLERYQGLGLGEGPKFRRVTHQGYDVFVWTSHGAGYSLVSEIGGRSCLVCHAATDRFDPAALSSDHR